MSLSCSKEDDSLVLRSTLSSSEYSLVQVDRSSNLLAFPSIASNADRSKIFIVYREGTEHASFDGILVQKESDDRGKTWKNRKIIYRPRPGYDARDPQLLTLPDGSILCRFFERTRLADDRIKSDVYCYVSKDEGQSYHFLSILPNNSGNILAAARGNMLMLNDNIYSVCYNAWSNSWLVKSSDWGLTWEYVASLDPFINKEYPSARINEVSISSLNGKIYMAGRQSEENDKYILWGVSEDLGKNWSWTKLLMQGHAPSLTSFEDFFIMTYRDNANFPVYNFNVVLMREHMPIANFVTLHTSKSFDIGYGDVLPLENSVLICFYSLHGIYCWEIEYSKLMKE